MNLTLKLTCGCGTSIEADCDSSAIYSKVMSDWQTFHVEHQQVDDVIEEVPTPIMFQPSRTQPTPGTIREQLARGFRLTVGRKPTTTELDALAKDYADLIRLNPPDRPIKAGRDHVGDPYIQLPPVNAWGTQAYAEWKREREVEERVTNSA